MLKILIVAVVLVVLAIMGLGVKLLFDKDAKFTHHSCTREIKDSNNLDGCIGCEIKESVDCSKNEEKYV